MTISNNVKELELHNNSIILPKVKFDDIETALTYLEQQKTILNELNLNLTTNKINNQKIVEKVCNILDIIIKVDNQAKNDIESISDILNPNDMEYELDQIQEIKKFLKLYDGKLTTLLSDIETTFIDYIESHSENFGQGNKVNVNFDNEIASWNNFESLNKDGKEWIIKIAQKLLWGIQSNIKKTQALNRFG